MVTTYPEDTKKLVHDWIQIHIGRGAPATLLQHDKRALFLKKDKLENTKGVISSRNSRKTQWQTEKGQTYIYVFEFIVKMRVLIVVSVLRFTDSDYTLWYLRFTDSDYTLCYLRFTDSDYTLWYLRFTNSDYSLWYLRFTASDFTLWYLQTFLIHNCSKFQEKHFISHKNVQNQRKICCYFFVNFP